MTLKNIIAPEERRKKLKELLKSKKLIRAIEAHSGISALIGNEFKLQVKKNKQTSILEFDAIWESSFTDSASKGLPDVEIVSSDSRLNTIQQIIGVTNKPIIVDGDTGGEINSFEYLVNRLERMGVSAVIIEDKKFPKRCSLDPDAKQELEDPDVFANKIKRGKQVLLSDNFMIIARIESLISGHGIDDALMRAKKYLKAGVDGIMIHSHDRSPEAVLKFAKEYNKICKQLGFRKPLVCVPTTYNTINEDELQKNGFNLVIYANHLLRASYKSMEEICKMILLNKRAFEVDPYCAPVNQIFNTVGFIDIKERDMETMKRRSKAKVIIPAAGEPLALKEVLKGLPKAMLDINGKSILRRQLDVLRRVGVNDVVVIRGYAKNKFDIKRIKYYDVDDYKKGILHSLFTVNNEMKDGFILVFSDILFEETIINKLLKSKEDIVIIVDSSYPFHRDTDKELDLVISKRQTTYYRELPSGVNKEVSFIGEKIKRDIATHEFIGIAKFSERGVKNLISVYEDCKKNHKGRFHESESFEKASFNDILQEMIDRGFKVYLLETFKGWMEIHNKKDYQLAKKMAF